jgi:hypothetical protein
VPDRCIVAASVVPQDAVQRPAEVNPKVLEDNAPPAWVLVKDEITPLNDDDGYVFRDSTNSSSTASPIPQVGKVVPLGPRAMNAFGEHCVGLRFRSKGHPGGRSRDRGRDMYLHKEYRPYWSEQESPYYTIGLRYVPAKGDVDVYRTVIIDMLPIETKLVDILRHAKQHPIISSKLIDTSKIKLKGTMQVAGTVSSHSFIRTPLS